MLAEAQRRGVLSAMGIDVYLLRGGAAHAHAATGADAPQQAAAELIVVCARADEGGTARLRNLLPLALGVELGRVRWIEADARGNLPEVPNAPAYLALGAAMPRALGANLSTMQQNSATIAAADDATLSLRDSLSKRALWQALKPLARRLRNRR